MSLLINESYANPAKPLWASVGVSGSLLPAGMLMQYAGTTAPAGWKVCDGSPISRTGFAELFALIGTTYGNGDGLTTFNLPNFSGKMARGVGAPPFTLGATAGNDSVTLVANNLPQHVHPITDPGHSHDVILTGLFNNGQTSTNATYVGQTLAGTAGSRTSDPGAAQTATTGITEAGNQVTTNSAVVITNPYLVVNYIIKYTSQNL